MSDIVDPSLIIAVESLKLRVKRIEDVLTNFVGVYKDADGVLRYGKQEAPVPTPEEPVTIPETETL